MNYAMKKSITILLFLAAVCMETTIFAGEDFTVRKLFKGCQVFLGPQAYHSYRTRTGGTFQEGWLYGAEAEIQKVRRYKLYWGAKGFISTGDIRGHSGTGNHLISTLTDSEVEGRIGYTWQCRRCPKVLLTPFFGYGIFHQKNIYKSPSPLKLHFTTSCRYASFGFRVAMLLNDIWNLGGDFSAQYVIEGKNRIAKDPVYDNTTQSIGEEMQYALEAYIKYKTCLCGQLFDIGAVPFFHYRHFGGRENFPFDFIATKYYNFGLRLGIFANF
jgi:hypothetical protein